MLLSGKTAFITGASRGIGKSIAKLYAAEGANLILVSRDLKCLQDLKKEIEDDHNVKCEVYSCDISKKSEIEDLFKILINNKLKIDILVNNAGIMEDATLMTIQPDIVDRTFSVNVMAPIYISQFVLKFFLKNRSGNIINLSSIIGVHGNSGQSVYSASKSAIIGFTKSLSKELARFNIRVNAIAPGFIETDLTMGFDDLKKEEILKSIGLKRTGTATDVAKTALYLASDMSDYVTGQIIGVDGGMRV